MTLNSDDLHGPEPRRAFLGSAGVGAVLLVSGCARQAQATRPERAPSQAGKAEKEVAANEDLMREHGVLDRLLLVYEASRVQITADAGFPTAPLHQAAGIVQRFIEQYHEKLEEEQIFPRFERAGQLVDLVSILRRQHSAGHQVTEGILRLTASGSAPTDTDALTRAIDAFVRMYRPHSAREDTVLFPALREIVSASELEELGEQFEEVEHQRFGEGGFSAIVEEVAELERGLQIHDLAQFTPQS
jgi:hemerythrin-like domain-containing protein